MKFTKMLGAGRDFVFVDCFAERTPRHPHGLALEVTDRKRGIGAESLILVEPSEVADARVRSYGSGGDETVACGSEIRCVAKYLFDHKHCEKTRIQIEAESTIFEVEVFRNQDVADRMRMDIGKPNFEVRDLSTTLAGNSKHANRVIDVPLDIQGFELPVSLVSVGSVASAQQPVHCVLFVEQLADELVFQLGALLEMSEAIPLQSKIEFVAIQSPNSVTQRTWQCGAGEIATNGEGAGAACVVGAASNRTERTTTHRLSDGQLDIQWDSQNDHVYVTGSAVEVFSGRWHGPS